MTIKQTLLMIHTIAS